MAKSRKAAKPQDDRPILYRVLDLLEDGQGGFYQPGTVLQADQVARDSLFPLLDAGVLMFCITPDQLAALPDHDEP